jgi:thiol-disulfide isomerase/thioredoxin
MEFMTKVIPQQTDTICTEANKILTKAKTNDEIFRCIMVSLFNHYATLANKVLVQGYVVPENVWVYLAEKWYIPFGVWSKDEYLETLQKEVEKKKPNLIGKQAPPMEMLRVLPSEHFRLAALDTAIKFDVHAGREMLDFRKELKSKFTAIIFWDYSCGHCKTFMEKMAQVYEENKNRGLAVITVQTVNTREAKGKWIDFINDHQMYDWTNTWSPYNNKYKDLYDIASTPLLYLLDEKGNIILKKMEPEHFKDFFENQTVRNQQ